MMDYDTIKEMAKDNKESVKEYLALSPGNDPFYVGSPGQMEKARWFAEIYERMGKPENCHIRRVHYWLDGQNPEDKKKPDGTIYENTVKDWGFMTLASKYARYAGLVPIENIVDRRNPKPMINLTNWLDEIPSETKEEIDAESIIESVASKFRCWNPNNTQAYHMEIWCEKSTMNDVLEPISRKYGMNLVTGLGELSITSVYQLIRRTLDIGKPVRIFYISDFDPAGECMPVSVARKIEFFIHQEGLEESIKLKQIMLTPEQCKTYDLPRTPIKETERRKGEFEERHGRGATELDAMEARHPGEMKKIIEKNILEYFDVDSWNAIIEKNEELQERVQVFMQDKMESVLKEIVDVLKGLDLTEFDEFEAPRSEEADEEDNNWILDSKLDYFEQMNKFKEFKRRNS